MKTKRVTAKYLRKLGDNEPVRVGTTKAADRELIRFAKLGFSNTTLFIKDAPAMQTIRTHLAGKGFRIFPSIDEILTLEVEW